MEPRGDLEADASKLNFAHCVRARRPGEIVFYRSLTGALLMLAFARWQGGSVATRLPGMHFWRSFSGVVSLRPKAFERHGLAVPLVELLHAVFHRALVRAGVVVAALEQGAPAGVHAQRDLVVL